MLFAGNILRHERIDPKFRAGCCRGPSAAPLTKGLPRSSGPRPRRLADTRFPHGANQLDRLTFRAGAPNDRISSGNGEELNSLLLCRPLYFLRKRSRRTTSPPPAGLSACASDVVAAPSGLAGTGTATFAWVTALCSAGERAASGSSAAAAPWPACSDASASAISSNCKPNCTEG